MSADWVECLVAANPPTKPTNLGCESANKWLLTSTFTITICHYYSARKLILILPSHRGWKAESIYALHSSKGVQFVPRLCIAVAVVINTIARSEIWTWVLSHRSQACTTRPLHLQRHVGVNNLLEVVTRQLSGWESNSQPWSCKSNAITTRLLTHLCLITTTLSC